MGNSNPSLTKRAKLWMKRFHKMSNSFFICFAAISALILSSHTAHAEESSILAGATTTTTEDSAANPSSYGINGSFNLGFVSDTTDSQTGVKEWRVKLTGEKKIVSFFF